MSPVSSWVCREHRDIFDAVWSWGAWWTGEQLYGTLLHVGSSSRLSDVASHIMQWTEAIHKSAQSTCVAESIQLVKSVIGKSNFSLISVVSLDSFASHFTMALSLQLAYQIIIQPDRLFYQSIVFFKFFTITFDLLGFHTSVLARSRSNWARYLPILLIIWIVQP